MQKGMGEIPFKGIFGKFSLIFGEAFGHLRPLNIIEVSE
jgi:hypothetical protein